MKYTTQNSFIISSSANYLYPNPQQFNPERFLERQYSPWEYIPD
ncbi:hypothetical protein [Amazonocrinis nigriterrae]|nr:hypothetical protein [Amazonocrinis nigriterrae]